jgi:hypothetical protein
MNFTSYVYYFSLFEQLSVHSINKTVYNYFDVVSEM